MLKLTKHLPFIVLYVSVVPQDLTIQYAIFFGAKQLNTCFTFLQILFRGCVKSGILFGVKFNVHICVRLLDFYTKLYVHCTEITHFMVSTISNVQEIASKRKMVNNDNPI